jgi:serine/threonine protein kinase
VSRRVTIASVSEVGATANKYEILAKLAKGGMAEIFLARGKGVAGVERYCVLKRILRERAQDAQFAQMFLDEARLAAQLQHPNIASVYDVGQLGDSYFFTMEYVHGETVRSLLQRLSELDRRLPLGCALTIAASAAAGLHHAHERNGFDGRPLRIVHRDVSPSNLMISYEGNVKVVDFGVAKAAHRSTETTSGALKGKISYMSPEQCQDRPLDRRSDLFSLGIVLWEMLTGKRLYRRDSDFENMTAIVNEEPVAPSVWRPDLLHQVDEIALRLLEKSADRRFQSAAEVVDRIEAVAVRAGVMVSPSALGRFVRELFGERPEPWLVLDSKPVWFEPGTLTGVPASTHSDASSVYDAVALEPGTDGGAARSVAGERHEAPLPSNPPSTLAPSMAGAPARTLVADAPSGSPPAAPARLSSVAITTVSASAVGRRRGSWLLASVIGSVAVAGAIAVWLMTSAGSPERPSHAVVSAAPVEERSNTPPPEASPSPPSPAPAAPPDVAQPPEVAQPPPPESPAAPPVTSKRRSKRTSSRPAPTPRVEPSRLTPADEAALSTCRAATMSARRAVDCTRVACRARAADRAFKWVAYVPMEQRAGLTAECGALGVELARQTLDCTADPGACP